MASIYERKHKGGKTSSYWIQYHIGTKPLRKRIREYGGATHAEAEAKLARIQVDLFEGKYLPGKRDAELTIEGLAKLWMESRAEKKTIKDDETRFRAIIDFFGANTLIVSLRNRDVDRFKADLSKRTVRGGKLMRPATVNRTLALLRSALRLAEVNEYAHHIKGIRLLPEKNRRTRICSPEEYEKLIEACTDPELKLAITISFFCGLRLGECARLCWSRVDMKTGFFRLRPEDTKNGEPRAIPMTAEVKAALEAYPRRIDGRVLTKKRNTLSPNFSLLRDKIGATGLRFHDLRRSFATRCWRANIDTFTIRKLGGWKSDAITRYLSESDDHLREAMDRASADSARRSTK